MRRKVLGSLAFLLTAATLAFAAAAPQMVLVARDLEEHPLAGLRFAYEGFESHPTNRVGATELALPQDHRPGQQIKILLVPGSKSAKKWFLINPQINVASGSASAEVVLMLRGDFRKLASEVRDAPSAKANGTNNRTEEDQHRALIAAAARYGLSAEQLDSAIRSFGETQDPKDKGIAAYLEGKYQKAVVFLSEAAHKKEGDLVETLLYLGAAQEEQAQYESAVATFRKALALRGDDTALLSWLGNSLRELAVWAEAEALMRRALALDEKSLGKEHLSVARDLNLLGVVLQATNRFAEAKFGRNSRVQA